MPGSRSSINFLLDTTSRVSGRASSYSGRGSGSGFDKSHSNSNSNRDLSRSDQAKKRRPEGRQVDNEKTSVF